MSQAYSNLFIFTQKLEMFFAFQRLTFFRNKLGQIYCSPSMETVTEKSLENEERKDIAKGHKNSSWKKNFCSCITKSIVSQLLKDKYMEPKDRTLMI